MKHELPEVNTDPKPEDLAKTRLPEPLPPSEKEIFEGKIKELAEENERLKAENAELKKPKKEPKKIGVLERFNPLG